MTLDEINGLDAVEALAFEVAFGEIEGGDFDWKRMDWRETKK
jgi:hypothetical protein